MKRLKKSYIVTIVVVILSTSLCTFFFNRYHFIKQNDFASQLSTKIASEITSTTKIVNDALQIITQYASQNTAYSKKVIDHSRLFIEPIRQILGASVIYFIKEDGTVVVSTYFNGTNSLENNNYKFRPYFVNAMNGSNDTYVALGVTTKERGIYFSAPIYKAHNNNEISGVVVIKMPVVEIENILRTYNNPVAMTVHEGIVFLANQDEWLFRPLLPIEAQARNNRVATKQFADEKFTNSIFKKEINNIRIDRNGEEYIFAASKNQLGDVVFVTKYVKTHLIKIVVLTLLINIIIAFVIITIGVNNYEKGAFYKKHKQVSTALTESETKHRLLFENTTDAIIMYDIETERIEHCNRAATNLFGFGYVMFLSLKLKDFVIRGDGEQASANYKSSNNKELPRWVFKRKDETVFVGEVSKNSFFGADGRMKMVSSIKDITEKNKLHEQLIHSEKMAAVGQLSAGVAHEFNNILAVIMGHCQVVSIMVQKNAIQVPEKIATTLHVIENQASRGSKIVRDMMSFSRPMQPFKSAISLNSVVDEILSFQEKQCALENIAITKNYCANGTVFIDKSQIQQVFLNLLINARHALKGKGGGVISISTYESDDKIEITFVDNGLGIKDENKSKIFTPFFTTKGALAEDELGLKGTGLGLSVSFQIINNHNGTISFTSKEGVGTTFRIQFPKHSSDETNVNSVATHQSHFQTISPPLVSHPPQSIENKIKKIKNEAITVLVVDDEIEITDMIHELLISIGVKNIDIINRPKEALAIYGLKRHDFVFLDIRMPDISGIELAELLKEMDPLVNITFLTGQMEYAEVDRESLIFPVIHKPFSINQIVNVIEPPIT